MDSGDSAAALARGRQCLDAAEAASDIPAGRVVYDAIAKIMGSRSAVISVSYSEGRCVAASTRVYTTNEGASLRHFRYKDDDTWSHRIVLLDPAGNEMERHIFHGRSATQRTELPGVVINYHIK